MIHISKKNYTIVFLAIISLTIIVLAFVIFTHYIIPHNFTNKKAETWNSQEAELDFSFPQKFPCVPKSNLIGNYHHNYSDDCAHRN